MEFINIGEVVGVPIFPEEHGPVLVSYHGFHVWDQGGTHYKFQHCPI